MMTSLLKKTALLTIHIFIGFVFLGCSTLPGFLKLQSSNTKPSPKLEVSVQWVRDSLAQRNMGFRKINRMSPLIYKDTVIMGNALDGLVAFKQDSGQELWRIAIPHGVEASAALINDRLFVGANNGLMYSVDLTQGKVLWTFDTKSEVVAEPLLQEGVLYFLSASQSIFALDAVSGKQLWTYNRQDTSNIMTIRGGSKPAFSQGILYVGFSDGSVVAFNAKTGTQQWEITLNKNTRFKDIDSSPVVDGEYIYINSYDDKIYCVSKANGEIIWSVRNGGISTPLISGDRLIYTTSRGEIVALAKKDGQQLWKTTSKNGIFTDPILYQNNMVVTGESQGSLLFLDATNGTQKASFEPGRGVFSRPTASLEKEKIYFISGEGNAYSIRAGLTTKASIEFLK